MMQECLLKKELARAAWAINRENLTFLLGNTLNNGIVEVSLLGIHKRAQLLCLGEFLRKR